MKDTATIILNRNLPKETNKLFEHLKKYDGNFTDIFVIEAGSERKNLSKYCTWYNNSPETIKSGLRYARGMNFGLANLWKEDKWKKYDSFFLITNDTKIPRNQKTIITLQKLLKKHPKVGIISPCSQKWGEKKLIGYNSIKYFWFIHNNAYFLRKNFVDQIVNKKKPYLKNFLFDGSNFRGYLSESELIAKAYANDWAAAITTSVFVEEDENLLLDKSSVIKTESYKENINLYVEEGLSWIHEKYGFNSKWQMMQYVKLFYDQFFEYFPEYKQFKI